MARADRMSFPSAIELLNTEALKQDELSKQQVFIDKTASNRSVIKYSRINHNFFLQ